MGKNSRINTIAEIINTQDVADQTALQKHLASLGIKVSQSSLSRDLKTLRVQKMRGKAGQWKYALPQDKDSSSSDKDFRRRISDSVFKIHRSGVMVVLHTPPGEAQSIGRLLDRANIKGLLGTVAGDDTIIAVAASDEMASRIFKYLHKIAFGTDNS